MTPTCPRTRSTLETGDSIGTKTDRRRTQDSNNNKMWLALVPKPISNIIVEDNKVLCFVTNLEKC